MKSGQLLAHHMFAQLPDGTMSYLTMDIREWTDPDTGEVLDLIGDAIVEISPDGEQEIIFMCGLARTHTRRTL